MIFELLRDTWLVFIAIFQPNDEIELFYPKTYEKRINGTMAISQRLTRILQEILCFAERSTKVHGASQNSSTVFDINGLFLAPLQNGSLHDN